jgi:hypothetical protein
MPVKQYAHEGEITFASGARVPFNINRYGVLHELLLKAQFTITNGGSSAVGPKAQTLARLFRKIEVAIMGRDIIWNMSGASVASMIYREQGRVAKGMDATVVLTNGAATTYEIFLPLRFCLPPRWAHRPDDTALDFRRGIDASLNVEFATTDCSDFYTTPNGAALSAVTVEVSSLREFEVPAERLYRVRTMDQIITGLPASNSALQIPIDKGSGVNVRSLMIETLADDVLVSTILGNGLVDLSTGQVPIDKIKAKHLFARNEDDLGVAGQTGVYHLDKTLFGSGYTMVPTLGLRSDLVLKLDATKVSGTNNILVTREGFRDPVIVG